MSNSTVFNIFDPQVLQHPYPYYAELREKAPICQTQPNGAWVVSRYQDVTYVLKHPELFSSVGALDIRRDIQDERLNKGEFVLGQVNLVGSDPPVHTQLRKLISAAFTPKAMTALEARVRAITTEYIDQILAKDAFDMMTDLARPLPVTVIAEMLGVEPAHRDDFKRWSSDVVDLPQVVRSDEEIARILRSRGEMRAYFAAVVQDRKRALREDLISDLCRGEAEYGVLGEENVAAMVRFLIIAGNETTTNLIGNGTKALLEHPEALRRLREEPALIPGFIEEVLRYYSPLRMLSRRTTREITLAGVTIPKDARVVPLIASANRDPAQFPDPDRFDITREPNGHMAFGYGIHFCVGAPLSRVEGRIAFEEILRRLPPFSAEPGQLTWGTSPLLHGLQTLPLRFERTAATE